MNFLLQINGRVVYVYQGINSRATLGNTYVPPPGRHKNDDKTIYFSLKELIHDINYESSIWSSGFKKKKKILVKEKYTQLYIVR